MYLIAGLGNPGGKYEKTRHNTGFRVIDLLARRHRIDITVKRHQALCGAGTIAGERVLLMKPQTYMNLSGESLRAAADFYKIDAGRELLVIYDDVDLAPGALRIRGKGSAGGHNGMKSIIRHLGREDFIRLRLGVGAKPEGWDLADYVLGRLPKEDEALLLEACERAADAAEEILHGGLESAMNRFNRGGHA